MGKRKKKNYANRQGDQRREGQKRGEEKRRENETGSVKRSCVGSVSVEAFDIFSQGRDLESCGGLSWKDLLEKREGWSGLEPETRVGVLVVPDVTDELVSLSSVFCDDRELVEPQSFLFSQKKRKKDEVRRLTSESASAV